MTNNRMPLIDSSQWSDEQRQCIEEILQGSRGALLPPFEPLVHSPELMQHTQRMGSYLRYNSAIGLKLSEFTILVVARFWNQSVEWAIHAPIAEQQGISKETINELNHREKPKTLSDEEDCIYHFCLSILERKKVSDALWQKAVMLFGNKGVVDLIGLVGYYTMLSFVMNTCQTPAPETGMQLLLDK